MLTGFGPFVAVYLTSQKWTQLDIGLVLTTAGLVALVGQMPGGALVDAARSERLVAGLAISAIGGSALALAAWPIVPVVHGAAVLQAAAACVLGPAIAAISLGLVGHAAAGERLGRNARFASLGTGLAAVAMGASGYLLSNQAVFFVTAAFVIPALLALSLIRAKEIDPETAHGGINEEPSEPRPHQRAVSLASLLRRRPFVIFAACADAVPACECGDAAAHGQRGDDALGPMGDGLDRSLHRRAAAGGRRDGARGRPPRAAARASAAAAARFRHGADSRHSVCSRD